MFGWFKKKSASYSLENLAAEVIDVAQKHYPKDQFTYDKKMNEVFSVSGDSPKTYLGNIFNAVKDMSPEDRETYLEDFFKTGKLSSSDLTLETLKSFLLTRVRTSSELGLRDFILSSMSSEAKNREFFSVKIGELFFDLTVDYGSSLSTPPKSDLINAGGGDEAVLDIALQNLKKISQGVHWQKVSPHIWYSTYEDDYDAARLVCLYPEYDLPDGVNNPIAYMPSHSDCLITDKDDPETLALLIQKGDEFAGNSRKLSKALWYNKNAGWHSLKLDETHPSHSIVQNQWTMETASFYEEQKEQLENALLKENKDIFVASVMMAKEEGNETIFSYSVLTFGVDTLLPKTDRIAFVDPDKPEKEQFLGMMPWHAFAEILGADNFTRYESLTPVRFHFPNGVKKDGRPKIKQHFE